MGYGVALAKKVDGFLLSSLCLTCASRGALARVVRHVAEDSRATLEERRNDSESARLSPRLTPKSTIS